MIDAFETVMNSEKNPLSNLPKAQRFQVMTALGAMWSAIFTFAIGHWVIYGYLLVFHIAIALGLTFTGVTFTLMRSKTPRDIIQREDGTPMYDDIWGAP